MADVSILDINGSQWNFKDTEARSLIAETNNNLITLSNRVDNIIYASQERSCGINIVVRIPRRSSKKVDILPLLNGKTPPTNADVIIQGSAFYGTKFGTAVTGTYSGDLQVSFPNTNAVMKYYYRTRQIEIFGNANDGNSIYFYWLFMVIIYIY